MSCLRVLLLLCLLVTSVSSWRRRRRRSCSARHGGWSGWGGWGACSCNHNSGTGTWTRYRSCNNPAPYCGGSGCHGSGSDTGRCDQHCCKRTNGGWTSWSGWDTCSCDHVTGTGTWARTRSCTHPPPSCGGNHCTGETRQVGSCNDQCCRIEHGGWGEWSGWGTCTCNYQSGTSIWSRDRSCNNPAPSCGGHQCSGQAQESVSCDQQCIAVNGGWSEYSSWSECSASCGVGIHTRTRTCTDPAPVFGGLACVGEGAEKRRCNEHPCQASCEIGNDPRVKTFDGHRYSVYGSCTYQAASCKDFTVWIKNVHQGVDSVYIEEITLEFRGHFFVIYASGFANVDNRTVEVPFEKTFNNGDLVSIDTRYHSGQLVMTLHSEDKDPNLVAITTQRIDNGRWMNVKIMLHGTCAQFTEGLCGNWDGDPTDDTVPVGQGTSCNRSSSA